MDGGAARDTRERILDVAEACLAEWGYHGTRLHQIAERVGIQKASLFYYFPSKEELYRAVVAAMFHDIEVTIRQVLAAETRPLEKLRALIDAYVAMIASHPARARIFLRQALGDAPSGYPTPESERLLGTVVDFVNRGQAAREFAPIDAAAFVLGLVGAVAFLMAAVPTVAPALLASTGEAERVDRVRRHVLDLVRRCLLEATAPRPAAVVD